MMEHQPNTNESAHFQLHCISWPSGPTQTCTILVVKKVLGGPHIGILRVGNA